MIIGKRMVEKFDFGYTRHIDSCLFRRAQIAAKPCSCCAVNGTNLRHSKLFTPSFPVTIAVVIFIWILPRRLLMGVYHQYTRSFLCFHRGSKEEHSSAPSSRGDRLAARTISIGSVLLVCVVCSALICAVFRSLRISKQFLRAQPVDSSYCKLTFVQTGCFICITKSHLRIFNISPLQEISQIDIGMFGSVFLCEMLARTNLIALVTTEKSHVFQLYDDCKKKIKMRLTFNQEICGIRIRRNIIAIVLRSETHIYKLNYRFDVLLKPTRLLDFVTCDNHLGLCDITRSDTSPIQLIVSPFTDKGVVHITNILHYRKELSYTEKYFVAHENSLSSIVLNYQGNLLATTSEKGTIIRIWDTISKKKIMEFRRGTTSARIYSMNFSQDSQFISCCSDKGTVHIFSMQKTESKFLSTVMSFTYADRSVATFATYSKCLFICAFVESDIIIAVGLNGAFRKYSFRNNKCKFLEYEEFLSLCANIENMS